MLGKLLKYEFKAMGRILFPLYCAAIIMGFITALLFRFTPNDDLNRLNIIALAAILAIMLFAVFVTATVGLSFIMSIYRFRKNLLCSEGYIMNTLPVTVGHHISAKLTVAMVFEILSIIVAVIAWVAFIIPISGVSCAEIINGFFVLINNINEKINISYGYIVVEFIVLILLEFVTLNMSIYASMCIGHSCNDHKILKSVGVYIVFYIVSQFINFILVNIFILSVGSADIASSVTSEASAISFFNKLLIGTGIEQVLFIVAYSLITYYFLKNKLNLQ